MRLAFIALLLIAPIPASATTCSALVARLQAYLAAHPRSDGDLPQTVGAQLEHQPTRASVARARAEGHDHLVGLLARARAAQRAGDPARCRRTLREVEWMLQP